MIRAGLIFMALLKSYELIIPGLGLVRYEQSLSNLCTCDEVGNVIQILDDEDERFLIDDMESLVKLYREGFCNE
jgi:hypothetical protein